MDDTKPRLYLAGENEEGNYIYAIHLRRSMAVSASSELTL
jgi:hypothetical protein